ncbi:MAG: PAS domain-containing sensor histidine kinase [Candidatus Krumholzibacteriia bacterium]
MPWPRLSRAVSWMLQPFHARPDRQVLLLVAALSLTPFILDAVGLLSFIDATAHLASASSGPGVTALMADSRQSLAALHLVQHLLILALAVGTFAFGWLYRRLSRDDDIAAWGFLVLGLGLLHTVPVLVLELVPGLQGHVDPHAPVLGVISRSAAMIFVAVGLWILTRRGYPRRPRHWRIATAGLAGSLGAATLFTVLAARAGLADLTGATVQLAGMLPLLLWGGAMAVATTAPPARNRSRSCLERATVLALVPLGMAQGYLAFASRWGGDNHPAIAHGLLAGACLLGCGGAVVDLLRLHDAQRGARERSFLRGLIDALPQLITLKDEQGRFTLVNRAAAEFMGRDPDQIIGRDPAEWGDDPAVAARFRAEDRRLLDEMRRDVREDTLADATGRLRVFLSLRQPILAPDEDALLVLGVSSEITELRSAQTALEDQNRLQSVLMDALPNPIFIKDPQGRYLGYNAACAEFFRRDRQELVGRTAGDLFPPERAQEHEMVDAHLMAAPGQHSYESILTRGDGSLRNVIMQKATFQNADGEVAGLIGLILDVTEARAAEAAVRTSEERWRTMIENQGEGVGIIDLEERFVFANPAAERIFGVPRDGLTARRLADFLAPQSLAHIRGEAGRNRRGERASYEVQITTPDGLARDLLVTVTPHRDADGTFAGLFGIFRDITVSKRAEQALRTSLKQTRMILDQASDPFVTLDEQRTVARWNRRAEELFGWSHQEVIGRPLADLLGNVAPRPDGDGLLDRLGPVLTGATARAAFRSTVRGRDGRELPVEVSAWSVRTEERTLVNAFMRDLSEEQAAQREKEILDVQLRQAQKLEAIGQLAAGIAHEINTPTQYVGDNLRFLADAFADVARALDAYGRLVAASRNGPPDPAVAAEVAQTLAGLDLGYLATEVPTALNQSLEGVERVATIVRAMKEFSHPGSQQKQAVDINHGIRNTITVSRNEWKYVAELETELDETLPAVPCLPGELNQVILNLIVNGAHAIRERTGGTGAKGTLRVATRRNGCCVEIRVSDDGAGIPAAIRDRIFEPFFTTKEVGKGTGQGLTIAHAVVTQKHGGTLTFETAEGRGTTFIIRLPLDPDGGQACGEAVHEEEHSVR